MKNTIKNTVQEVYNTDVKNMNLNSSLSASHFTSNIMKSLKSVNEQNNFSNNNVHASLGHVQKQNNMYILLFFLMIIVIGFSIVAYLFRDKIKALFRAKKSESKETVNIKVKDEELKETKSRSEDENNITEKDELLIKKGGKVVADDKITKNTKKNNESGSKTSTMKTLENKIYYSDDKIVKENNMYCYIGKDDDMRQCVQAFKDDVCTSGDIFNRIDKCLAPQKFT